MGLGINYKWAWGSFGDMKCYKTDLHWRFHHLVKLIKIIELCTWNGWIYDIQIFFNKVKNILNVDRITAHNTFIVL